MYYLLGVSTALALLLIVNLSATTLASLLWRIVSRYVLNWPVRARARMLFGLRVLPAAAAIGLVIAFVVPAYLIHESVDSGEVVGPKLALIAGLSSIAVVLAGFRVVQTCRSTGRLMKEWEAGATQITIEGIGLPIFKIAHSFPVLAVVGIVRPKIFVAEKVLSVLREEEFSAAIAHEYGHLKSRDNLKRTLLHICSDLLILQVGKNLDLAWEQTAEAVADEMAARDDSRRALDLASALVKISRIVPRAETHSLPIGAYIINDGNGHITDRVRRLLRSSEGVAEFPGHKSIAVPSYLSSLALMILLAIHFADRRLLLATHEAIEHFVWIIQ